MAPFGGEYEIGELAATVRSLTESVVDLKTEVRELKLSLDSINLFRAKVVGMATFGAFVVSLIGTALVEAVKVWAR